MALPAWRKHIPSLSSPLPDIWGKYMSCSALGDRMVWALPYKSSEWGLMTLKWLAVWNLAAAIREGGDFKGEMSSSPKWNGEPQISEDVGVWLIDWLIDLSLSIFLLWLWHYMWCRNTNFGIRPICVWTLPLALIGCASSYLTSLNLCFFIYNIEVVHISNSCWDERVTVVVHPTQWLYI